MKSITPSGKEPLNNSNSHVLNTLKCPIGTLHFRQWAWSQGSQELSRQRLLPIRNTLHLQAKFYKPLTNSLMCRKLNNKGKKTEGLRLYRANCLKVESLSHILQGCPSTHWFWVTRHNRLLSMVSDKFTSLGYQIITEPSIMIHGELRKPDLLLIKNNSVTVCDLTVGWESPITLYERHIAKVDYYGIQGIKQYTTDHWPAYSQHFQAVALSSRGGISSLSCTFLKDTGWDRKTLGLLCLCCMEKSLNINWGFFASNNRLGRVENLKPP
ncbi:unnamed protein product [Darwinula stevensoni]|uniref:Reverse transcriptase n=1 Tax=Darwinula stevensoni TaxID=69355 RepID=A0A7R8XFC2_9CRUS|nr:unnamed protein product [Darwinula stevensoni]CAG0890455.1 unnamed protein product [Darwinula stevensoni]